MTIDFNENCAFFYVKNYLETFVSQKIRTPCSISQSKQNVFSDLNVPREANEPEEQKKSFFCLLEIVVGAGEKDKETPGILVIRI